MAQFSRLVRAIHSSRRLGDAMRCFPLIKQVLDEAWEEIPGEVEAKRGLINAKLEWLSDQYEDLREYRGIDYGDPATRFAYVYQYVTSHANLVERRVRLSPEIREVLKREDVQVSCIGGGPGSDMLGIVKYMETAGGGGALTCNVLDAEPAWGDSWSGIFRKVDVGVRVFPSFQTFDVTKPGTWQNFRNVWRADLFTLVYFMSEVYGLKNESEPFFRHLFASAKPGALFLYIDNSLVNFPRWFDKMAEDAGLEIVDQGQGREVIPMDEQKRDLGEHLGRYARTPKAQTWIAWRIARKPEG